MIPQFAQYVAVPLDDSACNPPNGLVVQLQTALNGTTAQSLTTVARQLAASVSLLVCSSHLQSPYGRASVSEALTGSVRFYWDCPPSE